jgi:hypothetical protein
MTQDEIFDAARQSHLDVYALGRDKSQFIYRLEAFAKLVAAKEREACAKFFDDNDTLMFWGSQAATHIRARGEA